jgi:hypothetical protein
MTYQPYSKHNNTPILQKVKNFWVRSRFSVTFLTQKAYIQDKWDTFLTAQALLSFTISIAAAPIMMIYNQA